MKEDKQLVENLIKKMGMRKTLEGMVSTLKDQEKEEYAEKYISELRLSLEQALYQYENRYETY